jgi:hypothetical protein
MTKRLATIFLWSVGALVALYIGIMYLVSWQYSRSHSETWAAMERSTLECSPGTEVTTRGWSEAGYLRYCEPKKNGPWEAWSNGYRQVQGEYRDGKEHGTWRWFNRDGSIQSTVVYDNGSKVSEQGAAK